MAFDLSATGELVRRDDLQTLWAATLLRDWFPSLLLHSCSSSGSFRLHRGACVSSRKPLQCVLGARGLICKDDIWSLHKRGEKLAGLLCRPWCQLLFLFYSSTIFVLRFSDMSLQWPLLCCEETGDTLTGHQNSASLLSPGSWSLPSPRHPRPPPPLLPNSESASECVN